MSFKSVRILVIAITLIDASGAASAQNTVVGVGTASCGQWITMRNAKVASVDDGLQSWVQGFVSGMNLAYADAQKPLAVLPDGPTMLAYIDKRCRDNPLEGVLAASLALHAELPREARQ